MKTIRICLFQFDELSDQSQMTAINNHRDIDFEARKIEETNKKITDAVEFLEKLGIKGITAEHLKFDDNFKIKPFTAKVTVDRKFFADYGSYVLDGFDANSPIETTLTYSGEGKGQKGMSYTQVAGDKYNSIAAYVSGFVGAEMDSLEDSAKRADEYLRSDIHVKYELNYNRKDLLFHKDGTDAAEAELSLLK